MMKFFQIHKDIKESIKMINDSKIEYAEFEHFERVTDFRDLKSVRNFIKNPHSEDN